MAMDSKAIGVAIQQQREARGWTQERLAAETGSTQSTIDRIESGQFKRLPAILPEIARVLDLRFPGISLDRVQANRPPPEFLGEPDLKVFAAAEAGRGEMIVSTDPIEFVPRPWYLKNVRDGFAVLIVGDSMVPVFEPGDMAVVNPRLAPARGKDVILIADETAGDFRARLKRLVRWTERDWHLRQFNPPPGEKHEFTLARKAWPKALRVVGKYYGG